ncbi:MAG TPA: PIN domain-containing protein [Candidatus Woesebacteria bacterium]|nr:PIN domain-containing protein [Candidatus Woesebacteria bacterium]HNS64944.1 PIN domain-containing protein [Candidatus Woesebacteria bacterium]
MTDHYILDASICLALLFNDNPLQNIKAKRFFRQVESSIFKADLSLLTLNDLIISIEKMYDLNRRQYMMELRDLVSLKGIRIIEIKKFDCLHLLRKYEKNHLTFTDTYLLWLSEKQKLTLMTVNRRLENYCSSSSKL